MSGTHLAVNLNKEVVNLSKLVSIREDLVAWFELSARRPTNSKHRLQQHTGDNVSEEKHFGCWIGCKERKKENSENSTLPKNVQLCLGRPLFQLSCPFLLELIHFHDVIWKKRTGVCQCRPKKQKMTALASHHTSRESIPPTTIQQQQQPNAHHPHDGIRSRLQNLTHEATNHVLASFRHSKQNINEPTHPPQPQPPPPQLRLQNDSQLVRQLARIQVRKT
ncbi:hypothetical protein BCR33DRAFT_318863 [Rhizoclosmatium globosum]|uniref:Uncharacterized protein n=1 Tax=Rhizoclosmatium globosum TaxID=329046 RepID=A0A1Y2CZR0_9FUNG|nr:hypothetical protein BCR33DRAFT_318863 [Rhizoclosmatium globosum]|eukprot:ORY52490.1 hypothetical protein BCR33DRAFT_318863 [Rhizoclosmatium globosum]